MPVKIRLARFGKKANPYYHIVVADGRAPRDGKYIENIGSYNPKTNPATIELNMDKALDWLAKGAQPTDTTRAILSYKGILFRQHLNKGVKKGALTQEQADEKYNAWLEQKNLKVAQKIDAVRNSKKDSVKNRLSEEEKLRQKIAEKVAAKHIAAAEAASAAAAAAIPAPVEPAEPAAPAEGESTPPAENTEGNS
ncbi:MAG: 30S ribosomal protein S16 [Bacteroidia bacterium]